MHGENVNADWFPGQNKSSPGFSTKFVKFIEYKRGNLHEKPEILNHFVDFYICSVNWPE